MKKSVAWGLLTALRQRVDWLLIAGFVAGYLRDGSARLMHTGCLRFATHSGISASSAAAIVLIGLAGCGGGSSSGSTDGPTFVLGGTVTGLASGGQILLLSGAGTQTTIRGNGNFEFADRLKAGVAYAVTVNRQPVSQTCNISQGAGNIPTPGADVRNLTIVCAPNPHQLSGTVSGLRAGATVQLADGGPDAAAVSITSNGSFVFPARYASGARYSVSVTAQPTGQDCQVSSGAGTFAATSINSVQIVCTEVTPTVGGALTGLASGQQVVLTNNGADRLTLNSNGVFQFPSPIGFGSTYSVAIAVQPATQVCAVANAGGAGVTSAVQSVRVTCAARSYAVGGTVVGLSGTSLAPGLALLNNGQDMTRIGANGAFTFPAALPSGSPYSVTVASQPAGQTCTVLGGSGRIEATDIRSVSIQCVAGAWRSRVLAGSGVGRTTDGTGASAELWAPSSLGILPSGSLVVSEISGSVLRRVNPGNGQVTTYSGASLPGYVDSTSTRLAAYRAPHGVAVDRNGNVYVADTGNHVIRRIDAFSGEVTTWAGTGQSGWVDGPGAAARFQAPQAVAVDAAGQVYVADTGNHVIRRISTDRSVTTLAGTAGVPGFSDGTSASARFQGPAGIAVDAAGQIYVSDTLNGSIRVVSPAGRVSTIAGNGQPGDADGAGADARFAFPVGMLVDAQYTVYVADSGNHKIKTIQLSGGAGWVQTLAGTGFPGDADGENLSIGLRQPYGVIVTPTGELIVAEAGGHRIRLLSRSTSR